MASASHAIDSATVNMRRAARPAAHELSDLDAAPEIPDDASIAFPEGGREAWTCLLGSSLMMFPSFGFQTASEYHP